MRVCGLDALALRKETSVYGGISSSSDMNVLTILILGPSMYCQQIYILLMMLVMVYYLL